MELDSRVLDSLALGGDDVSFDDKQFARLAEVALRVAANELDAATEAKLLSSFKSDALKTKQLYAALLSVVIEAARHDASTNELSSVIEDKLTAERTTLLTGAFEAARTRIRARLAQTATAFPSIVDLSWRVDYYVQNNMLEQIRVPVYFVTLKTQAPEDNSIKEVTFTASLEQLQDLLAQTKDACSAAKLLTTA